MIIKKAHYKQSSWAGGTTTELFIYPLDSSYHTRNFDVRISSATVEIEKSVFTSLPDYNRSLMVIEGNLEIKHQGHYSKNLIPFECDNFDGAWNTSSLGQARDFNLMTSKNLKGELSFQEKEAKHKFKLENRCNNLFVGIYLISGKLISNDRKQCIESEDLLILTKLNEIIELQALERSKIIYIYVSK